MMEHESDATTVACDGAGTAGRFRHGGRPRTLGSIGLAAIMIAGALALSSCAPPPGGPPPRYARPAMVPPGPIGPGGFCWHTPGPCGPFRP